MLGLGLVQSPLVTESAGLSDMPTDVLSLVLDNAVSQTLADGIRLLAYFLPQLWSFCKWFNEDASKVDNFG